MFLVWWLGFHLPPFENTPGTRSAFYRAMTLMVVGESLRVGPFDSVGNPRRDRLGRASRCAISRRWSDRAPRANQRGRTRQDRNLDHRELTVVGLRKFSTGSRGPRSWNSPTRSRRNRSIHWRARFFAMRGLRNVRALEVTEFRNIVGQGVRGTLGGTPTLLGGAASFSQAGPLAEWAEKLPQAPAELAEIWGRRQWSHRTRLVERPDPRRNRGRSLAEPPTSRNPHG